MAKRTSISKTFVWIILGLLILGLAGFGATNLSGTIRTVGKVGDQSISVDDYARELQREMRAFQAQTGQPVTMEQATAFGLDRTVLARLVSLAALDNEVAELGISVGDENLQKEIVAIPAFQGINGSFDRDSYRFALEQAGINESEFEADLRQESARSLVQRAIVDGTRMPDIFGETLVNYVTARRSFTWAALDAGDLSDPLPEPTASDLQGYYDANLDQFMLPETKSITYALLSPDALLDQVAVDETALRALYDERTAEFNQPERRLVERLAFADAAGADDAMAQIEVGGTTFEALVEERGLNLSDVDLGDVSAADLGDAADAVFAAEIGDVVGPFASDLGPALFRVNGVLAARATSFDAARDQLQDELAADRARRLVEAQAQNFEDLLAGGATLEELAGETDMTLGTIDWTPETRDDIAAYDGFRSAAAAVTSDDFPEISFLEDGSVFAMRLDDVLPPRPQPFDAARDRVAEGWSREVTQAALLARAEAAMSAMSSGGGFEDAGLTPRAETGLTRTAFIEGAAPDFMVQVFQMEPGELRVVSSATGVQIVRLDETLPPAETADLAAMGDAVSAELDQALAQALFATFAADAQARANPQIDQRALNAVQTSFQ